MRRRPKFERSVESDYFHHSGELRFCSRRLDKMTVAAVHPDSASLELHMNIGTPEFAKLAHLLTLTKIECYGQPSQKALGTWRTKAATLGDGGTVVVIGRFAGFTHNASITT